MRLITIKTVSPVPHILQILAPTASQFPSAVTSTSLKQTLMSPEPLCGCYARISGDFDSYLLIFHVEFHCLGPRSSLPFTDLLLYF